MPVRVRSRAMTNDGAARSPSPTLVHHEGDPPEIGDNDTFREVIKKLSIFLTDVITLPSTFEQLRTTAAGDCLRFLVDYLSANCKNPSIVNSLLALKWHYNTAPDPRGLNETRANACEIVAWRFLTRLSEREAVDFCLYEIPDPEETRVSQNNDIENSGPSERDPLLIQAQNAIGNAISDVAGPPSSPSRTGRHRSSTVSRTGSTRRVALLDSITQLTATIVEGSSDDEEHDPTSPFIQLNALEIAAIADAKRFLSQHVVQKIITGIWNGEIIFWDQLSVHATKKPRYYNSATADPFSRLRVPKYLKSFEVFFFLVLLFLYYSVLVKQATFSIPVVEVMLYFWLAAFTYDEISEWIDAGSIFYTADVWNLFDMIMICIGIAFACMRIAGLYTHNEELISKAFDVLSLEALFMVPRIFSILSLSPYWGTLIPCLRAMGKDFIKFMVLVVVIYLGFLTTFSLISRDTFTLPQMTMILTKIFFGSTYVGFDVMTLIDEVFGPPLMLIFITLSSILLMGSLTGMLSNSFSRVITHAREEYLYVYSVYVLEASTSNRLTHFYPPFNLLALIIFRPLRLFLPSDNKFRAARIILLKATHLPIVGVIEAYEYFVGKVSAKREEFARFRGPRMQTQKTLRRPPFNNTGFGNGSHTQIPEASAHAHIPRSRRQAGLEDDGEVPTDVEVKIAELNQKIDRLTDLVITLQSQNDKI
ncbi:uncharacterized protein MKZ38_002389 [Zalerion maritima]|uniref:Calcium channel YVC1-like C-terminal transmembrane domain-containing protein n=1 Tax=Zalerion maritima TaxID=339359 RepID=A0AAD5RP12_9PEZI|nr:uncharacterized protein MKZ38_002389 [Zalerion maritima]